MEACETRDVTRQPLAIYEVHLGSWKQAEDLSCRCRPVPGSTTASTDGTGSPAPATNRPWWRSRRRRQLGYREIAEALVAHVKDLGFNYIELMPVAEHPYDGSWGYQITGYFAPTARFGSPDDFRSFVDHCHQNGVGVILDWVPAHFVKDAHGLGHFDGTALYEHEDPRRGLHPDWDTYIFNYGRFEVRSFLLSNALYWLEEFHVDGSEGRRGGVDALPRLQPRGGRVAAQRRRRARESRSRVAVARRQPDGGMSGFPGRFTVAEESTAWEGVTRAVADGGLGFTFKWNLGWMHDTLGYFGVDPLFRSGCHDQLTFAMVYEHSERFINPLSHDEVVHGKGSLYNKMPGDPWRKRADLRTLLAYQFTRPGKKLLFMGSELASTREWNHETSLDWYLLGDPDRAAIHRFVCDLGALYQEHPCLWRSDPDPRGFEWIACWDKECSVISYERRLADDETAGGETAGDGAGDRLIVVLNHDPGTARGLPRRRAPPGPLPSPDVVRRGALRRQRLCHSRTKSRPRRSTPTVAAIRWSSPCRRWRPWCWLRPRSRERNPIQYSTGYSAWLYQEAFARSAKGS